MGVVNNYPVEDATLGEPELVDPFRLARMGTPIIVPQYWGRGMQAVSKACVDRAEGRSMYSGAHYDRIVTRM